MFLKEVLSENNARLTPAQQRVIRYMIDRYEEAIFLTASGLARRAGVSEATVVRLAQNLGYDGYPGMQRKFREDLQDRLSTVSRLEQTVEHVQDEGDVLLKVLQQDIQNISQTLRDLPLETFRQAVADMRAARRIFVAGLRGAHAPALVLATYLRFTQKETQLLKPGHGDLWDIIHGVGSGDLVVGISFPRCTRLTMEILQQAYQQGARVGAITDSLISPLARHAHWVLAAHCQLDSFIESFTAAMSLVNALLTAMSIQDPQETLRSLQDHEKLWKAKGVYLESGRATGG